MAPTMPTAMSTVPMLRKGRLSCHEPKQNRNQRYLCQFHDRILHPEDVL